MKKRISLIIVLIIGFLSYVGITTADEPIFGEIIVLPEEPIRLSEVKFTVNVTGDNIDEVRIIVEECAKDLCYEELLNESMKNIGSDIWESAVKLVHDDTTHCNSWLVIKSNGTWYDYKSDMTRYANFTVVQGVDGADGNGENGVNDIDSTPGFEFMFVIIAYAFIMFFRKTENK